MKHRIGNFLSMVCLLTSLTAANAFTLDWNSVDWTDTTTSTSGASQSFNIDGNTITISITRINSNSFFDSDPNGGTPIDDGTIVTGSNTSNESLHIFANHNSSSNNGILVTMSFSYAISNVNFTVFDVDTNQGQYRDRLDTFTGTLGGSQVSSPTITKSSYNNDDTNSGRVRGDDEPNRNAEPFEDLGNAGISYGSTLVDQVSFIWRNDGEDGYQGIAISDITYTPEPTTYLAGFLLILLAGFHWMKNRRRLPSDVA